MSDAVIVHDNENEPVVFTQDELGWLPWLEPLAEALLKSNLERQRAEQTEATRQLPRRQRPR